MASPECRVLWCRPCWTVSEKTNMKAPKLKKNGRARALPRRIDRTANSEGDNKGERPCRSVRRSTRYVAAAATGETASRIQRPQRPAQRSPLSEGHEQREHREAEQCGAGRVHRGRVRRAGVRHQAPPGDDPEHSDGHVHEKDRAPRLPGNVRRDQQAPDELPGRRRHAGRRTVEADRLPLTLAGEGGVEGAERLRHDRGRRAPLRDPGAHQDIDVGCEAADEPGQRESAKPGDEHGAPAVGIAEPAAHDQEQRVGRPVAGHGQLERRRRALSVGLIDGSATLTMNWSRNGRTAPQQDRDADTRELGRQRLMGAVGCDGTVHGASHGRSISLPGRELRGTSGP